MNIVFSTFVNLFLFKLILSEELYFEQNVSWSYYYLPYGKLFKYFSLYLDVGETGTFLFGNMNPELANEINLSPQQKFFYKSVYINGLTLKNFKFTVKNSTDPAQTNQLDGILGLGISKKGNNTFMDYLKVNGFVNQRIIFIQSEIFSYLLFKSDFSKKELSEFHYCNQNQKFKGEWSCDLSHIVFGEDIIQVNNKTRVKLMPSSLFTKVPYDYLSTFYIRSFFVKDKCHEEFLNKNEKEIIVVCKYTTNEILHHSSERMLINIGGVGFTFDENSIFFRYDNELSVFMIAFTKSEKYVWTLGYNAVSNGIFGFDYDNRRIGFRGYNYVNMTGEYDEWKENIQHIERFYTLQAIFIVLAIIVGTLLLYGVYRIYRSRRMESSQRAIDFFKQAEENH